MKKMIVMASVLLITGRLFAAGIDQQAPPTQTETEAAAPDAAAVPAVVPIKKKARVQQPAAVSQDPEPAAAAAVVSVPPIVPVEEATAVPAAVSAPAAPEAVRPQACPNCFQPLLAGYNEIIADLKSWMDGMDAQAADLDRRLSEMQKRIDEKDDAIEKAKLGTDKKAAKTAVKALNKERKMELKEYAGASDEKDRFYKKFSKEAEKKVEGYNKITAAKLRITLSAASQ
jgi:hypothetical protein